MGRKTTRPDVTAASPDMDLARTCMNGNNVHNPRRIINRVLKKENAISDFFLAKVLFLPRFSSGRADQQCRFCLV
jgi:hypothetical protein